MGAQFVWWAALDSTRWQELLATIRDRYRASSKREKSRILDEFIAVTGHHRKHGIRLLGQSGKRLGATAGGKKGRRIYDEAVRQALIVVWEAADRICHVRAERTLIPALAAAVSCVLPSIRFCLSSLICRFVINGTSVPNDYPLSTGKIVDATRRTIVVYQRAHGA